MRLKFSALVLLLAIGCGDKAQPGLQQCQQLLEAGKLADASAACEAAYLLSPKSPKGVQAAELKGVIDQKIDDLVPATVTAEWCGRLAARLEPRLLGQAQAKYPTHDPGFLTQSIHGNVENTAYNCRQAVGKPTEGLWLCRWNENLDTASDCDRFEERPHVSR